MMGRWIQNVYEADTSTILCRHPTVGFTDHATRAYSLHELETTIQQRLDEKSNDISNRFPTWNHSFLKTGYSELSYSIIIPYCTHFQFFIENLDALVRAISKIPSIPVEVLIINDDPTMPSDKLDKVIPGALRNRIRIIDNPCQIGIARTLNRGIQEAKYQWLVHVDCDDLLTPKSLKILSRRIRQFPFARYISSRMIDVDESSKTLRVRLRTEPLQDFSTKGMVAGHLKAIRRDLFRDIGIYDERFNGCQDYEFALRTILVEPILLIPDYLYQYRWHRQTQSVNNTIRQHRLTAFLQHLYRASAIFLDPTEKPPPVRIQFHGKDQSCWNRAFENWGDSPEPLLFVQVQSEMALTDYSRTLFVVELMKTFYEMGNTFQEPHLSMSFPRFG